MRARLNEAGGCLERRIFAGASIACREMTLEIGPVFRRLAIEKVHQAFLKFPASHCVPPSRSSILRSF